VRCPAPGDRPTDRPTDRSVINHPHLTSRHPATRSDVMQGPLRYCLFNYSLFCRIPFNEDNYWPYGKKYGRLRSGGGQNTAFCNKCSSKFHIRNACKLFIAKPEGRRPFESVAVHKITSHCVIAGFRRDAEETCALQGCYVAYSGNSVPMFRHKLSVPSSGAKKSQKNVICILNIGVWCTGS